ncbi:L,D-transpeptidase [Candidatus Woesearchaeota archaeon]|nr:L,D-transpeptidase [Candidatus Woesearchaeota archaeon]
MVVRVAPARYLRVSLGDQRLVVVEQDVVISQYPVSTALKGAGERHGSGCTPRGWLVIRAKIGQGCPRGTVFVGRRPTGEYYDEALEARFPDRDWILTRILWLGGLEAGFNRYGEVDTARRYIYIHGSPDQGVTGTPASHGCIRMRQDDVMSLFDQILPGTHVQVQK